MNDDEIIEKEANYFAMCLLMPEPWVRRDVKALGGIDIEDDLAIHKLAQKYKVSTQLMTLRIAQIFKIIPGHVSAS